ncbi:hypothetical protein C5689_04145 [Methylosinus sporium]|uniref:Uncharacterized protein n=1 Tax=Methylosinus sporium TaxID=428 RepID=A0A2U1SUN9_METSR|nr:hypothetical protein C5689_04145 [Methylosinus sporium]
MSGPPLDAEFRSFDAADAARAIVAAGLDTSLGLFHRSRGDALRAAGKNSDRRALKIWPPR